METEKKDDEDETEELEREDAAAGDEEAAEGVPPAQAEDVERVFTQAELQSRLDAAAADAKERHLRLAAEYDNFRRRVQREKEQWSNEAIERFVTDLLPVLDDFDRALVAAGDATTPVAEGIRLTEKHLRSTLGRHGVETIDPSGGKFDPQVHEAVQRVPPTAEAPAGTVVQVFEKGYALKGRLLRPARVLVASDH